MAMWRCHGGGDDGAGGVGGGLVGGGLGGRLSSGGD